MADKTVIINKPTKFDSVIVPKIGIKKAELFSFEYGDMFKRCVKNVMKENDNIDVGRRFF